jgi:hypothetical protein
VENLEPVEVVIVDEEGEVDLPESGVLDMESVPKESDIK